jgi:hypothetical protein
MRMKTSSENASAEAGSRSARKASTNELPMVELGAILDFVEKIEVEGLQTLPQQEVARRLNYAAQTSTPFYRRMVAAKLFGLVDTTQGVNLTKLALDYFKPTDEHAKAAALFTSVKNVVGYQTLIERYANTRKRLPPVDILRNAFERDFKLTAEAAKICAEAFLRSTEQAGMVQEGMLSTSLAPPGLVATKEAKSTASGHVPTFTASSPSSEGNESHYLTLDAKHSRRVIIQAPPVVTRAELERIQNWLAVQLHVVENSKEVESTMGGHIQDGDAGQMADN